MHPSVSQLWLSFVNSEYAPRGLTHDPRSVFHFCDNAADANECAELVKSGRKRATAPSVWGLQARGERIPEPGHHHVVTDWDGVAQCVIRTIGVTVVPFNEVTPEHAMAEGEGDGSLEFWRSTHWAYYQRELSGTEYAPTEEMPIACERFTVVYPPPRD